MPNTIQAFGVGIVCGMRAAFGPALVSHKLSQHKSPNLGRLNFMRSSTTATALKVAAAGELIGDKLPLTPNRTEVGPLCGRIASGALCGAALSADRRDNRMAGALIGGVAAVAGAYAFYHLRRTLTQRGAPDVVVALLEDALATLGGSAALGSRREG